MLTTTIPLSSIPPPDHLAEIRRIQLAHGLGYQIPGHPDHRPRRTTPCLYRGRLAPRERARPDLPSCIGGLWHECEAGRGEAGECRPGVECQMCEGYEADG